MANPKQVRKWQTPRLVGEIWTCGDICECSQPQIVLVRPNHRAGFPWLKRDRAWKGRFASYASDPAHYGYEEQLEALRGQCERLDIPPTDKVGERAWRYERKADPNEIRAILGKETSTFIDNCR